VRFGGRRRVALRGAAGGRSLGNGGLRRGAAGGATRSSGEALARQRWASVLRSGRIPPRNSPPVRCGAGRPGGATRRRSARSCEEVGSWQRKRNGHGSSS
jgi:hypothetical protein